jgi:hypothetical protein
MLSEVWMFDGHDHWYRIFYMDMYRVCYKLGNAADAQCLV